MPKKAAGTSLDRRLLTAALALAVTALAPAAVRALPASLPSPTLVPRASLEATLPPELRLAPAAAPFVAEPWLAGDEWSEHVVRIRWRAREHAGLDNYRVTYVSDAGGPGEVAARWTIPAGSGHSTAGDLRSYALELPLGIHGELEGRAALEAVDALGGVRLLGVFTVKAAPHEPTRRLSPATPVPAESVRAGVPAPRGFDGPRPHCNGCFELAGVVPRAARESGGEVLPWLTVSVAAPQMRGPPRQPRAG